MNEWMNINIDIDISIQRDVECFHQQTGEDGEEDNQRT